MDVDRRSSDRVIVELSTSLSTMRGQDSRSASHAEIVDVSAGGMFVRFRGRTVAGGRVLVCINSRTEGLCAASGVAVRVTAEGFGVEFHRISASMTALLSAFADQTVPEQDVPDTQIWLS